MGGIRRAAAAQRSGSAATRAAPGARRGPPAPRVPSGRAAAGPRTATRRRRRRRSRARPRSARRRSGGADRERGARRGRSRGRGRCSQTPGRSPGWRGSSSSPRAGRDEIRVGRVARIAPERDEMAALPARGDGHPHRDRAPRPGGSRVAPRSGTRGGRGRDRGASRSAAWRAAGVERRPVGSVEPWPAAASRTAPARRASR